MAVDLSVLADITSTANSLSNIILVRPQENSGFVPQLPPGTTGPNQAVGFIFHYEGENTVTLESDITDHFVEDNTAINDQISLKPEMVTTHGFIGELNNVVPPQLIPLKQVADKLTLLSPFVPVISATALIAFNAAQQAYTTAANAKSAAVAAWSSVSGGGTPVQTLQQQAFTQFYGYWRNRQLFTIQTPWAKFTDMAIKTLRAVQDEDTRMITDFEITFKKMRFAQTITSLSTPTTQGRLGAQSSPIADQGVSAPAETISLSDQIAATGVA